ncbi:hypothetical protein Tco_1291826 [Tanacetum coccineum]
MSAITDIKCALTQKSLDAFCTKYHIPDEQTFDYAATCYTKPLDSLKNWNDHFFWVDDFACPASFPWHTAKNVTRDPAPVAADFNAQDYATLVAHPSPEDMDIFSFIHTPDPTKVKVVEQERKEDEPLLLQTTVGRTVPLLLVAPDHAESELEASVDKLFDEGGSGDQTEQGGSASSGRGVDIQLVSDAKDTVAEDGCASFYSQNVQVTSIEKRKTLW